MFEYRYTNIIHEAVKDYNFGFDLSTGFLFNREELVETATKEGYYTILVGDNSVENIRLDGTKISFHSLENNENGLLGFDRSKWNYDKICWVGPGHFYSSEEWRPMDNMWSINFFCRKYYKGVASKTFSFHRDAGPAIVSTNFVFWMKDGVYHNDNGPASLSRRSIEWCRNGKWHNENGPAQIFSNGELRWYTNHIYQGRFIDGKLEKVTDVV
jgi:hypothetical protein